MTATILSLRPPAPDRHRDRLDARSRARAANRRGRARARHRHDRRAGAAGGFRPSALRQSGRAQGRQDHLWRGRHLRQPQSLHRPGRLHLGARPVAIRCSASSSSNPCSSAAPTSPSRSTATSPRPSKRRPTARWVEFTLNPKARFSDGDAGHGRRRDLLHRAPARQGAAELQGLLFEDQRRREGRRARRPLRPQGRRRPRAAADHRADADPAEARHRPGHVRQVDAEAADRQRPLSSIGEVSPPNFDRLQAQPRLLGQGPADPARPLQLRRDPRRVLPRRQHHVRGVQEGPLRRQARRRSGASGTPPTTSPPSNQRRGRQGDLQDRHAQGHVRLRLQHAPAGLRRQARARGAGEPLRLRLGQQEPLLRRIRARGRLFQRFRAVGGRPAGERQGEGAAGALPRRGRRRRDGRHLQAGIGRRCGRRPRRCMRDGARRAAGGRLRPQGQPARQHQDRPAARLRDHGRQQRGRETGAGLPAHAGPHRHQGDGAQRRGRAVPAAAAAVRLRHDAPVVGCVAVARQRAARPLEQRRPTGRTARSTMPAPSSRRSTP